MEFFEGGAHGTDGKGTGDHKLSENDTRYGIGDSRSSELTKGIFYGNPNGRGKKYE